jgi:hypothetical protein
VKVWLVIRHDYEDDSVIAVWDTKDAADADCANHKARDMQAVPYGWRVEEHEVLTGGHNTDSIPKEEA